MAYSFGEQTRRPGLPDGKFPIDDDPFGEEPIPGIPGIPELPYEQPMEQQQQGLPQTEERPDFGINSKVLEHLIDRKAPPVDGQRISPNLAAAMAKGASMAGTIGGKSADTSTIDNYAKQLNSQRAGEDSQRNKLQMYLQGRRDNRQDYGRNRGHELEDRDNKRLYDAGLLKDARAYLDKIRGEKAARKSKMKPYREQLAGMSQENLKRFDSAAMGLRHMFELRKALNEGENTFEWIGSSKFTMARDKVVEAFGRMQSGGAITEWEQKTFQEMLPKVGDNIEIQKGKMKDMLEIMASRVENLGFNFKEVMTKMDDVSSRMETYVWEKEKTGKAPGATTAPTTSKKDKYEKVDGGWRLKKQVKYHKKTGTPYELIDGAWKKKGSQ